MKAAAVGTPYLPLSLSHTPALPSALPLDISISTPVGRKNLTGRIGGY